MLIDTFRIIATQPLEGIDKHRPLNKMAFAFNCLLHFGLKAGLEVVL